MRRMRRHYNYTSFDENDSDNSMSGYFLPGQQNRDYDNVHSLRKQHGFMSINDISRKGALYRSDETVYKSLGNEDNDKYRNQQDNHGGNDDKERDDDDDCYEIVSDRYLSPSKSTSSFPTGRVFLPKRFSDSDIHNTRRGEMSSKPIKKKIVCKFCATSKQFGSCPCPIHLPTVQSRYLRSIQDNTRNAMTINVFRNGDYRSTPTMIHFSKANICSMEEIMKIIDNFIRFPVGYAYALYTLLGDLIEDPADLEPYEMYVVVNNCKKEFIPLEYGSKTPSSLNVGRRRRAFALAPFIRG